MKRFIASLFVAASFGSSPLPATESAPVVAAPAGTLRGVAEGGIHVFKGIPYALPPTGPMRWKPPVPAASWTNTRGATEFGFVCVQPKPQPGSIYAWDPRPMSEDCLSLNIWAPAGARNAPVFFWIHGGALSSGTGSDGLYNGSALAARGLVVVSINYRLGVLGIRS
jgi:para-nitrobenzyl esterase